jgi:hypothetical protein
MGGYVSVGGETLPKLNTVQLSLQLSFHRPALDDRPIWLKIVMYYHIPTHWFSPRRYKFGLEGTGLNTGGVLPGVSCTKEWSTDAAQAVCMALANILQYDAAVPSVWSCCSCSGFPGITTTNFSWPSGW